MYRILSFYDRYQFNDINLSDGHFYKRSGFDSGSSSGSANEASLRNGMEGEKEDLHSKMQSVNVLNSLDMQPEATKSSESPGHFPPVSHEADNNITNWLDKQQDNYLATTSSESPGHITVPFSHQELSILQPKAPLPLEEAATGGDKPPPVVEIRKIMSPEELAGLALHNPKRAKRIMTNRLSAVRAKEKKKLEINMLEHRWHDLHSKLTQMEFEMSKKQAEHSNLTAENILLKERTSIVLQQIHLQDSLIDEMKNDIQSIEARLGPIAPNGEAGTTPLPNKNAPPPMLDTQQLLTVQFPHQNNSSPPLMLATQQPQNLQPSDQNNNTPLPMLATQKPRNIQCPHQNHFLRQPYGGGFQQPYCGPNSYVRNPQTCLNQAQNKQGQGAVPLPFAPQGQFMMCYEQLSIDGDFSNDNIDFLPLSVGRNGNNI